MKLNIILLAALMSTTAFAQTSPAAASDAPVAAASAAAVNPFTGKPLSGEELQARLEASRMLTSSLEEQLKQITLSGEIETVPLRKAAEAAAVRSTTRTEELKLAAVEEEVRDRAAERAKKRADEKAAAKAEKAAAKAAALAAAERAKHPELVEQAVRVAPPRPTLLSVLTSGGVTSAMLDFAGATVVVADGGMTPVGPVTIIDGESVSLGGQTFSVSSTTLSRFAAPPVVEVATSNVRTPRPVAAPTTANPTSALGAQVLADSASASGRGAAATLPPLQLPPGMQVMPPSK